MIRLVFFIYLQNLRLNMCLNRVIKPVRLLKTDESSIKISKSKIVLIMAATGRLSLLQICSCSIIDWFETTSNELNMRKLCVFTIMQTFNKMERWLQKLLEERPLRPHTNLGGGKLLNFKIRNFHQAACVCHTSKILTVRYMFWGLTNLSWQVTNSLVFNKKYANLR